MNIHKVCIDLNALEDSVIHIQSLVYIKIHSHRENQRKIHKNMNIKTHIWMHTLKGTHTQVLMYISVKTLTSWQIDTHNHTNNHTHTHTHTHTQIYIYIYTYICKYIYMYNHFYTFLEFQAHFYMYS